ncbi:MAG TPA: hypothetical protein VEB40_11675 [Flavipsychrobacter sp.]|nr:hypothetical protein [Flavipsychrobacter sp.]
MRVDINAEEVALLNYLLKVLPEDENFNLEKTHRTNGASDRDDLEADRVKIINQFKEKGVYKNLEDAMLHYGLAVLKSESDGQRILRFSYYGACLRAFGDYDTFCTAAPVMSEDEVISHVSRIIEMAQQYGAFTLVPTFFPTKVVPKEGASNRWHKYTEADVARLDEERKEEFKRSYIQYLKDDKVLDYLVENGFAITRSDIQDEWKMYRELTDKGRELKQCKTIEAYNAKIQEQQDKMEAEALWRAETSRNQVRLAEEQAVLSKNQYLVNICIAVATGVMAILGFFQLTEFYEKHTVNWRYVAYFLSGAAITLMLLLLRWQLKKYLNKDEKQT